MPVPSGCSRPITTWMASSLLFRVSPVWKGHKMAADVLFGCPLRSRYTGRRKDGSGRYRASSCGDDARPGPEIRALSGVLLSQADSAGLSGVVRGSRPAESPSLPPGYVLVFSGCVRVTAARFLFTQKPPARPGSASEKKIPNRDWLQRPRRGCREL